MLPSAYRKKLWPDKGGYRYRAERIARTEINAAYAQSYLEVNDDLNENVYDKGGFEAKIMHLSALNVNNAKDSRSKTWKAVHVRRASYVVGRGWQPY